MLVTKKDGTHEPFNDKKIIDAVNKSAERCNNKKYDADKLLAMVHKTVDNCNELTVAIIHDAVITALNSLNKEIAEKYSSYHNYRQDFVKMLDTIHRASQKIRYIGDKENANSDSALVATKRCLIFNELNKQLYRKFFMRADELQACKDGYIYIHDQNARLDTLNCFGRSTRFITDKGVKSFYDFCDGDEIKVLSHKGVWRKAIVHSYGWQRLQKVTFKRASGKEKSVLVTPNHRWILKDGSETTELKVGDALIKTPNVADFEWESLSRTNKKLWCLGFGFGDGAIIDYNDSKIMIIRLCGKKISFADRFEEVGYSVTYPQCANGDAMVFMIDIHSKELPLFTLNNENIKFFVNGLLCADGEKNKSNHASPFRGLQVTGYLNDYIVDMLNMAGYYVTSSRDLTNQVTNYGVRTKNTIHYQLYSDSGRSNWVVKSITPEKLNPRAQVWCLEVEEDHSFILDGGIPTGNCCLFDMGNVLKGGFEMGNLKYTEPNSIATAFNVMADVILATASQQYGGFTICEVDKILSPYANKSYQKYRDEYLSIKNNMADAIKWAWDHVERDIEQGYQGIEMTLNSVGSSRGDYPFITFTFGLGSDPFSRLISITMLNVHKKGQGGKPVLFPKLVFLYDKNLHDEGCINHDVYLSALACSAKTMYPDWLSLTGDGYVPSMYKKYGQVVSPMGCAEGSHTVGYSYRGEYYYESLKRLWDKMSELYGSQKQANGRDEYIIPKDLTIYDTKKGFVKVTCMNRNTQSKWVKVKIKGGRYLKVTDDHPLPTQRGRVLARDLRIGDKLTVNYSQYVNETKSMPKDEAWLLGFRLCDGYYNGYGQIPTCIFSCNRDSRLSFLEGLIDADGHLDVPDKTIRLQLGSTNEELALQLVALLQSVGVKAKVYPSRYGSGNKLRYKVEGFITQELYDRIVRAKKRVKGDFAKPIEGECIVEAEIYDLEPYEKEQYAYDVTTESDHFELNHVYSHNCRAFLSPWYERGGMEPEDESDTPVFVGRFNMGVVSLHLPMILAKARKENKDFYKVLDYYLEMIRGIHKRTYDYLGELKASVNPVCFCEGGFYGGHLKPSDKIKPLLKAMTASFGITALNELQRLYNGKSLVEDGEFALEVMKYINDYINRIKYEDNILYATYGTPAENLCFSGDTTVQTYSGYKKIKDITTNDLVYSFNEKEHKIELKPVIFAGKTGENRQVVKVTFDNGQEIICTPNHQFAVRKINVDESGKVQGKEYIEYVPAGLLKEGTRIKSNYITEKNGRPFCSIYHNGKIQGIHEINAEYKLGKKPNGYVIHHLDEDKYNNSFDNLVYWTEAEHKKYHMKDTIGKYCYTSEQVVGENNPFYNKHHTEVSKQLNRERHLGKNNVQSKAIVELDLNGNIINTFESKGMAEAHYDDVRNLSYALNAKYTTKSNPHEYKGRLWYFQDDIENISFVNHTVRSVEYLDEAIDVYDITVADNHNFFVGGAHGVLVHNCGKQIEQFRKIYGVVENVSDKAYVSNSFHCHVSEDINPIEKQDLEGRFWDFFNGGKIQYVRYPVQYNTEAIDTLIKRAMKKGFYEGVNLSLAYCDDCGYEQLEMDVCPKCGSKNITKIDRMNGYLAYSRIHGDTRLNDAKMAEIKDRKSM